jgi:hypothetical protein
MLFTRSASSPPSPPSFVFGFLFLQNLRFLHLFFLLSGAEEVDEGADVDVSSLPRTLHAGPEADNVPQHAPALRRRFLPLLHLFVAVESIPIAGSTREGGGTLGSIRAGRVAGFLGHTSTPTGAGISGRESCIFVLFLEGEVGGREPNLAKCSSLSVPVRNLSPKFCRKPSCGVLFDDLEWRINLTADLEGSVTFL